MALAAIWSLCSSAEAEQPCPPELSGEGNVVQAATACGGGSTSGSDTPDYVDPVANVTLLGGRRIVNVSSGSSLVGAANDASCGDTLQLAPGNYTSNFEINRQCPANNPVIVRGAPGFGSVVNAQASLTGSRNIITGIDFNGGNARVQVYGVNNKLIGNKIRNWTTPKAVMTGGGAGQREQEIAYNVIGPPGGPASAVRFGVKADTSSSSDTVPINVWVHHNDFNGFPDGSKNDTDPMEPGNTSHAWANTFMAGWYIEDNLFRDYSDCHQNAIDMKFSGTVIRRNTVINDCIVKITARIGAYDIFESNYLDKGEILTHGRGHKVVCNTGSIRVQAGEQDEDFTGKDHNDRVPHLRSYDVLVARNNGSVSVGHQPNSKYTRPAYGTTIEEQHGSVNFGLQTNTRDNRNNPSSYRCEPAFRLNESQVGPVALGSSTQDYKGARGL